jgi:hypothetical protein
MSAAAASSSPSVRSPVVTRGTMVWAAVADAWHAADRAGGRNIMFDCGMHMGYNDQRRFPNFSYISKTGQFTQVIDAVIISHL